MLGPATAEMSTKPSESQPKGLFSCCCTAHPRAIEAAAAAAEPVVAPAADRDENASTIQRGWRNKLAADYPRQVRACVDGSARIHAPPTEPRIPAARAARPIRQLTACNLETCHSSNC